MRQIMFEQHYCFPDNHQPHKYYSLQPDLSLTPALKEVPQLISFAAA